MLQEANVSEQASVTPLLGSILEDGRQLLRQEFALLRSEIRHKLAKTKTTAFYIIAASVLSLISFGLLLIMLVHYLALHMAGLPLWGCYGVVAILTGAGAFFLMLLAKRKH